MAKRRRFDVKLEEQAAVVKRAGQLGGFRSANA
jgi:hypothetical protein